MKRIEELLKLLEENNALISSPGGKNDLIKSNIDIIIALLKIETTALFAKI